MFVWTKECYNIRVVLTEPLIGMGVSDGRGRKRKGRKEGRSEFLSSTTAGSPSLAGSAKPQLTSPNFSEPSASFFGDNANHISFDWCKTHDLL